MENYVKNYQLTDLEYYDLLKKDFEAYYSDNALFFVENIKDFVETKTFKLDQILKIIGVSHYNYESLSLIYDYADGNLNLCKIRKNLENSTDSLTKRAWSLKTAYPDLLAFPWSKFPAWACLLKLDKVLCDSIEIEEKQIIPDIDDEIEILLNQISAISESEDIKICKQVKQLPESIIKEIAGLCGLKYDFVINKINKFSELNEDLTYIDYPEPHEKYGRSFSRLNAYKQQLVKQLDERSKALKTIHIFAEKTKNTILPIIQFHEENGTLEIISGNENTVKNLTDFRVKEAVRRWQINCINKETLSPADISAGLRASSPSNISRNLRSVGRTGMADLASALGLVSEKRGSISHWNTTFFKIQMERKAKEWAQKVIVRLDESKQEISLYDVIQSKKKARLSSLFAITNAYVEEANKMGLSAFFGTLTLPSEFHPAPKSHGSRKNEKWDYYKNNCVATRNALTDLFSKFRASMKKHKEFRGMFGFKVVEFHSDGCPHIHFMLFLPKTVTNYKKLTTKDSYNVVSSIMNRITSGSGDFNKNGENPVNHRYDLKLIEKNEEDEETASPASYIMTYIKKSLEIVDPDKMELIDDGVKHKAQLTAYNMRGYGFLGGRGIRSIWDRLYNMKPENGSKLPKIWLPIYENIQIAKENWLLSVDADSDLEEQNYKKISREASRKALTLLNAFPHSQQSYKIKTEYANTVNKYLEKSKKAIGFSIIDEHEEVFTITLKDFETSLDSIPDADGIDRTGIQTNKMRKEITERLFNIVDELNYRDSEKLQGIYTNNLKELYKQCILDVNYVIENTKYDSLVSLILTYPRVKPRLDFELSDNDQIPIEYIQSLLSLEALRRFSG